MNSRRIAFICPPPTDPGSLCYLGLWGSWLAGQTSFKSAEQMVLLPSPRLVLGDAFRTGTFVRELADGKDSKRILGGFLKAVSGRI